MEKSQSGESESARDRLDRAGTCGLWGGVTLLEATVYRLGRGEGSVVAEGA